VLAFSAHPAFITLGDAIQVAWSYLAATWRKWLPVVVVVGVTQALVAAYIGSVAYNSTDFLIEDPITGRFVWNDEAASMFWRMMAASGAEMIVSLVASWAIAGIAIAGLRGRPITPNWILGRGLVALVSSILVSLVIIGLIILWVVAFVISAVFPPLLLVTIPGGIAVLIWVGVRLIFATLAVFDGYGPLDALSESWALSHRSVMRLLGWGIVAGLLAIAFGLLTNALTGVFATGGMQIVTSGFTLAISEVGGCFTTFLMSVLYESQRLRRNIMAGSEPMPAVPYGVPGVGPYPGGPVIPGWNSGAPVYPPVYPPSAYPTTPQPGWGTPAAGGGYPGWGNPQAGYPGAYRGAYQPNQFGAAGAQPYEPGDASAPFGYADQQGNATVPADATWAGTTWQAEAPSEGPGPRDNEPGTDTSGTPS
jgi:hypothetical protein